MKNYILATQKPWNLTAFEKWRSALTGKWCIVTAKEDLDHAIASCDPRYVFFPHWSHIVPEKVLAAVDCVCFHMADVPYGRGGSPLQNLITRGHKDTVLTALKMTPDLDAGPVYLKKPLSLAGSATDIFKRAASVSLAMIAEIVETEPTPIPQSGEATIFQRRTPEQSLIPTDIDLPDLYDHIRMLDAASYPQAYIDYGPWRVTFSQAKHESTFVEAHVKFERREEVI